MSWPNETQGVLQIALDYEKHFDYGLSERWMSEHWHVVFYFIIAYILLVFKGEPLMSQRPPFELRYFLVIWNLCLTILSTIASIRTSPEFIHILSAYGLRYSICPTNCHPETEIGFWIWVSTWNRVFELGDTVIIVLRKQKLVFLHYYHHAFVLFYSFYTYGYEPFTAMTRWFLVMNYNIHAIMYMYYLVRALRFKMPRWVAMCVTSLQIIQMIIGSLIIASIMFFQLKGETCCVSSGNLGISFVMYFTMFMLFGRMFMKNYMGKPTSVNNASLESKKVK